MLIVFQNREEAGKLLAQKLGSYRNNNGTLVLAIPRGGVVVGKQIALNLKLPISCVVVKKVGAPNNPELAIGAVSSNGVKYIDWDLAFRSEVEQEYLDKEIKRKQEEVEEREKKLGTKNLELKTENKKIFILVDDGVATGATVLVAIKYIKEKFTVHDSRFTIILAVPVIAKDTYDKLQSEVDRIVALEVTLSFGAVGEFYREFPQVSDEEVIKILKDNRR